MASGAEVSEDGGHMEDILELTNGVLHLRPVKWMAVWHILKKLGGAQVLENPDKLHEMGERGMVQAADATVQLFDYCAGWGVTDDPPAEDLAELEALGLADRDKPHLARANWLRFSFLADDDEASDLLAAVLALTWQSMEEEEVEADGDN